jgi:ribosomal protein S27AE
LAYLVLAFSFALAGGIVGKSKGSSFWIWFMISGFLPFIGLMAALLYRRERDELRRQCPQCGKVVKLHDQLCTCGAELYFPDVAISPESAVTRR